jgi:hypothetical protein
MSAAELTEAYSTSLVDWLLLAHCPVLIASAASGFTRSAAAAGWASTLWYVDEDWLGGRVSEEEPCRPQRGPGTIVSAASEIGAVPPWF